MQPVFQQRGCGTTGTAPLALPGPRIIRRAPGLAGLLASTFVFQELERREGHKQAPQG